MAKRRQRIPEHTTRPEIRERFEKLMKKPKRAGTYSAWRLTKKIDLLRWPSMEEVE